MSDIPPILWIAGGLLVLYLISRLIHGKGDAKKSQETLFAGIAGVIIFVLVKMIIYKNIDVSDLIDWLLGGGL